MTERLYAYQRNRLSVSAYGKQQNCAAAYILSTHYQVAEGLESEALRNGLKVHAELETRQTVHGYKILAHEKKVEIDGPDTGAWMGYIDAICVDDDGEEFVVDFKTGKAPATKSWAAGYLLSLQGALYTFASKLATFAIYHPRDERMYMTQLNMSVSAARLKRAYNAFMSWQASGQQYSCKPSWVCKWCDFQGHCEWLITHPGCELPPTLQLKKDSRR